MNRGDKELPPPTHPSPSLKGKPFTLPAERNPDGGPIARAFTSCHGAPGLPPLATVTYLRGAPFFKPFVTLSVCQPNNPNGCAYVYTRKTNQTQRKTMKHYWVSFLRPDGIAPLGTQDQMSIPGYRYKTRAGLVRHGIRPYMNGRAARVEVCHGNKYADPVEVFVVRP